MQIFSQKKLCDTGFKRIKQSPSFVFQWISEVSKVYEESGEGEGKGEAAIREEGEQGTDDVLTFWVVKG